MEQATFKVVSPALRARGWRNFPKTAGLWLFALLLLSYAPASHSDSDPSAAAVHKYMSDMDARGDGYRPGNNEYSPSRVANFEHGLERKVQDMEAPPQDDEPPPSPVVSDRAVVLGASLAGGAFLLLVVLAPKFAPYLNKRFGHLLPGSKAAESLSHAALAQEQQFSEFLTRFQNGPAATPAAETLSEAEVAAKVLERFFETVPQPLESIRTLFAQLSSAQDDETCHKLLGDMCAETRRLRLFCEAPQFKPMWQLATALEQLLRQLADRTCEITPSLLRTTASAVVCLDRLCKPGVPWERGNNPPIRFLAVDDDPVCRHALAATLKKTFTPPDLAENGQVGLAFASDHSYDAIFLDVEMPDMDGFELCTKIHLTQTNQKTPVVFVTCHSDFDSRAKSTEVGGFDLIAKPFLPLELIVKSLTLVLRCRMLSATPDEVPLLSDQVAAAETETLAESKTALPPQEAEVPAQPEITKPVISETSFEHEAEELPQASEDLVASNAEDHADSNVDGEAALPPQDEEIPAQPEEVPAEPEINVAFTPEAQFEADAEELPQDEQVAANGADALAANNDTPLPQDEEVPAEAEIAGSFTPEPRFEHDVEELPQADEQVAANGAQAHAANNGARPPQDEEIPAEPAIARGLTPTTASSRDVDFAASGFFTNLPPGGRFQVLRSHLEALGSAENSGARQEALGQFYVGIQPIVAETERAGLHSATSVGFALENLVKKLLQHPDWNTVSALNTTAAALGLFEELASSDTDNNIANPALKILVVDDDPISRRALSNALQLMFGRPDLADCGKAAVKLASEKQYDVIFLDVLMPDMDGFAACKMIRETQTNKTAPIVFVTGENSVKAHDQALGSGGNGFIPKPVLPAEIALAATTFGLTARLRQHEPTGHPETSARAGKIAELAKP